MIDLWSILDGWCLFCLQATQSCQLTVEESSTDSTTPDDHATNVVKGVGAARMAVSMLTLGSHKMGACRLHVQLSAVH